MELSLKFAKTTCKTFNMIKNQVFVCKNHDFHALWRNTQSHCTQIAKHQMTTSSSSPPHQNQGMYNSKPIDEPKISKHTKFITCKTLINWMWNLIVQWCKNLRSLLSWFNPADLITPKFHDTRMREVEILGLRLQSIDHLHRLIRLTQFLINSEGKEWMQATLRSINVQNW